MLMSKTTQEQVLKTPPSPKRNHVSNAQLPEVLEIPTMC